MSQDIIIRKTLLLSLSEPEYARVDFFKAKQADSIYSEKVYALKLQEALEYYISKVRNREKQVNTLGNHVYDFKLSLFNETEGELYGHLGYGELESLANSISQLVDSWYPKKGDKIPQVKNMHPIHWLKGDESLRQFLDIIKSAGLIENRVIDEIIQEHFRQTDKKPQPIQWSKSNRLLIYLFNKLTEAGLIDTMDRQFKLITEHFLDRHGQKFKRDSLKQDFQNMKYSSDPRGSKTIDKIIQEVSD